MEIVRISMMETTPADLAELKFQPLPSDMLARFKKLVEKCKAGPTFDKVDTYAKMMRADIRSLGFVTAVLLPDDWAPSYFVAHLAAELNFYEMNALYPTEGKGRKGTYPIDDWVHITEAEKAAEEGGPEYRREEYAAVDDAVRAYLDEMAKVDED